MSHTARTIASIIAFGLLSVPAASGAQEVTVIHDLTGPNTQTIDLFAPAEPGDEPVPLVVLLHGGGNTGNGDMHRLAQAVASRGAAVFVPTYYSGQPRTRQAVRDTFEDVVCSVRYARNQASRYGADPDNLILVGFSYGGLPGSGLALTPHGGYDFSCLDHISHVPEAFIGLGGAYHYGWRIQTLWGEVDASHFTPEGKTGRSVDVPMMLIHGVRDTNVPIDHAESYYERLVDAGHHPGLHVANTRHSELVDPDDPEAGGIAVEAILGAARGELESGLSGVSTRGASPYARLAQQVRP